MSTIGRDRAKSLGKRGMTASSVPDDAWDGLEGITEDEAVGSLGFAHSAPKLELGGVIRGMA